MGTIALVGTAAKGIVSRRQLRPEHITCPDPVSGETWKMIDEDAVIVGPRKGECGGWVEATGYHPNNPLEEGQRLGRWFNSEGKGVMRFERLPGGKSKK